MKKILVTILLVLGLESGDCQELNMGLSGTFPGRAEAGLVMFDTINSRSSYYITSGLGWFESPYVYVGMGFNFQVVQNLTANVELFPVISTEHRSQVDRGNNMVGDELTFGIRTRVGPQYTFQILPKLDLVLRAGVELMCPVLATGNAASQLEVYGFGGVGLILHTL